MHESRKRKLTPGIKSGQLTPLTPMVYNQLTVSNTVSIDEPAGGYMEMTEYRNAARVHLIALESKDAREEMTQGTTMKQKAYGA